MIPRENVRFSTFLRFVRNRTEILLTVLNRLRKPRFETVNYGFPITDRNTKSDQINQIMV